MKKRGLLLIFITCISFMVLINTLLLPKVDNAEIDLGKFSALRAMEHLKIIAEKPHPSESIENEKVRKYIVDELSKIDKDVQIQSEYIERYQKKWGRMAKGNINNIIVKIEGTDNNEDAILLTSHHDTVSSSPGAADATSGVATIIECLRAIQHNGGLKNDVIVLISDGEEKGMLGAGAFAKSNPLIDNVKVVVNLEARGNTGIATMFQTGNGNFELIKAMNKSVDRPFAFSAASEVFDMMSNDSDFSVYMENGNIGYNFANIEGAETYHQMTDNVENYNVPTLQHYGDSILSLVTYLGNNNLNNLSKTTNNGVYFSLTRSIFVNYSEKLAVPIAIIIALLFMFIVIKSKQRGDIKLRKVLLGFILNNITLISIYIFITAMIRPLYLWLLKLKYGVASSAEFMNSLKDFKFNIPNLSIGLFVTVVILIIANYIINKIINEKENTISCLSLWVFLMLITAFMLKGASYLFTWISLVFILHLAVTTFMKKSKERDIVLFILLCIGIFISVNMYGIGVYLAYIGLTISKVGIIFVTIGIWGVLMLATLRNSNLNYCLKV